MKKLIAMSILAATVLSGCAIYPTGYSEYSSYSYDYFPATSGIIYIDQTYVTPTPHPYWRNNYPNSRWDNRPPVRPPYIIPKPNTERPPVHFNNGQNINRPPQGKPRNDNENRERPNR